MPRRTDISSMLLMGAGLIEIDHALQFAKRKFSYNG